jgi:integrase
MSEVNSTADVLASKPAKPTPDFPLFPHATRRWAKKIKGKLRYFGPWDDHQGALKAYEDFLAGKPLPSKPVDPNKPAKPYDRFPLFAHATGRWAKKIRGQLHYFGPWDDPQAALDNYLKHKDALHAGKKPREKAEGVTVNDAVNRFLHDKKALVEVGELSPRTWSDYENACIQLAKAVGKRRLVIDLDADDFAKLRNKLARMWGPVRVGKTVQCIRCLFKFAFESELIAVPVRFGPGFKRPNKKTMRLHRAKQGPKLFTADEIHKLLDAAGVQLKAMILLGINCGFGNSDCATLPLSALDLESGWVDYPRPKTGIARRAPLWPETIAAIRVALACRPRSKSAANARLVFITKHGLSWSKDTSDNPISKEIAKLLHELHINGRKGRGFLALRHTFRTVADEAKDQPAVDFCMGHEVPHMSSVYRETISDVRLRNVGDYVRSWLFPPAASKTMAE